MPRYMIQTSHDPTPTTCGRVLAGLLRAGAHYLRRADWGCERGVHVGWLIVEAKSDDDARLMVPPAFRSNALVVRVHRLTPEEAQALHGPPAGRGAEEGALEPVGVA